MKSEKIIGFNFKSTGFIFFVFGLIFVSIILFGFRSSYGREFHIPKGSTVIILSGNDDHGYNSRDHKKNNPNQSIIFVKEFKPTNTTLKPVFVRFTLEGLVEYNNYDKDQRVDKRMVKAKRSFSRFLISNNWFHYIGDEGEMIDAGKISIKQDVSGSFQGEDVSGMKMYVRIGDIVERKTMIKYRGGDLDEFYQKVIKRAEKYIKIKYRLF